MNKKLLTVAIGAALTVGAPLVASAAGPEVFGQVHMSYDRADDDSDVQREQSFISSNDSNFGIKGDDDLGNGLKAIYYVKSGAFLADSGTSGFGNTLQDTYAGLSQGAWGTVKLGRHNSPSKDLSRAIDYFSNRVGDSRIIIGKGGFSSFDGRLSNMVRYESPKVFGGLQIKAEYGSSENAALSSTNTDTGSGSVTWASGPLYVGMSFEQHNVPDDEDAKDETAIRVGAKYNIGMFDVRGFYEQLSDLNGVAGADRDSIGIGGSFKFGNNVLKAQYYVTDKVKTSAAENGAKNWTIGLDHNLSKSTFVYAMYTKTTNDEGTRAFTYTSNTSDTNTGGGHSNSITPTTNGASPNAFSVGLKVSFGAGGG